MAHGARAGEGHLKSPSSWPGCSGRDPGRHPTARAASGPGGQRCEAWAHAAFRTRDVSWPEHLGDSWAQPWWARAGSESPAGKSGKPFGAFTAWAQAAGPGRASVGQQPLPTTPRPPPWGHHCPALSPSPVPHSGSAHSCGAAAAPLPSVLLSSSSSCPCPPESPPGA